jgi:hypothetical protein
VADENAFGADEDAFDEQAQDALPFGDGGGAGVGAELAEEVFEAGGELGVGLAVDELRGSAASWLRRLLSRERSSGMRSRSSSREISSSW